MSQLSTDANVSTKQHSISQTASHKYIISHACPLGTHEDATMAKDSLRYGGGCWNTVH